MRRSCARSSLRFGPLSPRDSCSTKCCACSRPSRSSCSSSTEIQHVLAGPLLKQRQFLNVIKHLGNELQIPIVAAGTQDAFNAIQTDPQLANRFEPAVLRRWTIGEDYLRLLASFEVALPLEQRSGLVEPALALKILSLSEGTIGEISALLCRAAIDAIESETEQITSALGGHLKMYHPW